MREKGMGYIIAFFDLMILNQFAVMWIWPYIYDCTGKSPQEISRYRRKVRYNPKKLYVWLTENSSDRKGTGRRLMFYYLSKLPALLGVIVSVIGLFTSLVDPVMDIGFFVVMFFGMGSMIAGPIFGNRSLK